MLVPPLLAASVTPERAPAMPEDVRIRSLVDEHTDFVWRTLRRMGLPAAAAEDAAQQVFVVACARIAEIVPGAEQAFLFKTALYIAARARRSVGRRREDLTEDPGERCIDGAPSAEELLDRKYARALLDRALDGMAVDERAVFVLFELEEKATAEIAHMLEIPQGTVASRLRRARTEFMAFIKRVRASEARRTRR
jgi:RNA polymerase sigma-70 factor (ECF subfamily)